MHRLLGALALCSLVCSLAHADEGMWLFNRPPAKALKEKYGFSADAAWYENLQKSCVRFSTGGSGSIVSAGGLVMTNHHVGSDMLERLSTPEKNLLDTGFYAASHEEEPKCPDLELLQLDSIEDVTQRIKSAATAQMSSAQAEDARKKAIGEVQNEAEKATGLDCRVVTLYQGGEYHLYRYKRYTDIRLVFAPEMRVAFFGGDTDNFEFPRYDLDVCFFRIYVDGKPARFEHFLRWSESGCNTGDLVFVAGHPGSTDRLDTMSDLIFQRDVSYPGTMRRLWRREVQLQTFSGRSAENARIAIGDLFGVANARKANTGTLQALHDPALLARKESEESALQRAVMGNPEYKKQWGNGWDLVTEAKRIHAELFTRSNAYRQLTRCDLFDMALHLVRLADELPKPNADRLPEYRDSELDSLKLGLFSPAPIYPSLETNRLWSALSFLAEELGGGDRVVADAFAGKAPDVRAAELIAGTKLIDLAERQRLFDGGKKAIDASTDPLIVFARQLDGELRAQRTKMEDEVDARETEGYAKLAAAAFAVQGPDSYPDATFTLRLSYGVVKGYKTADGTEVEPFTRMSGMYKRSAERAGETAFALPKRWIDGKRALDLSIPMNFVSTCDIIGGNSGSPTVDRKGEVVGLIFDGNIESLSFDIAYSEERARAISVDSRAIIECLFNLYGAQALAAELTSK